MKVTCNIVEDLLPLYVDEICSEDSEKIIKSHIKDCSKCKEKLLIMQERIEDKDEIVIFKELNAKKVLQKTFLFVSVKAIGTISLLMSILLFWVLYFSYENERLDYFLREVLTVPLNILMFLIPALGVVFIIHFIVNLCKKRNIRKNTINLIVVLLLSIVHMMIFLYVFSIVTTTGIKTVVNKETENNKYFIYIDNDWENEQNNIKLEVDKDLYTKVIVDDNVVYSVEYKFSKYNPEKGELIYFSVEDKIDNR